MLTQLPTEGISLVISDLHSNLPALEAIIKHADKLGYDHLISLGDVVGYGPWPGECVARLELHERHLLLKGNHEHYLQQKELPNVNPDAVAAIEYARKQLKQSKIDALQEWPERIDHQAVTLVHASLADTPHFLGYIFPQTLQKNFSACAEENCRMLLYGHTHLGALYRQDPKGNIQQSSPTTLQYSSLSGRVMLNPGSAGQPRDNDPRAAFALWDHSNQLISFHRVEYPIDQTAKAIRAAGLPRNNAARLWLGR